MAGAPRLVLAGMAALAVPLPAAARPAGPPQGTLTLDLDDPVVVVIIGGMPLRLRVDLDQRDAIEINDDVAGRLALPFERGSTDEVGRIEVPSRIAPASFEMNGRTMLATLSTHGRCCRGVDGAVSPALLPYAVIRFVRAGAAAGSTLSFTITRDSDYGLQSPQPAGRETVLVKFSLTRGETLATASAGAILAQAQGGRFTGGTTPAEVAFGIERPTRTITFDRAITLAGFRFAAIRTRTADFGGRRQLPQEANAPDEIVVRRRVRRQQDWPAIVIGRDRLDRCSEISLAPSTATLTLRCDFGSGA